MNDGLVKTQNFKAPLYLGDPINAVRIFNEKEVDELIILDITATNEQKNPNYSRIGEIVSESFMPVGYGGGINNLEQIKRIFDVGVEKIIINSAMFDFKLIEDAASIFGNQSVVISIDVKKSLFSGYQVFTCSGRKKHKIDYLQLAKNVASAGAGEIVIQSIDREGMMKGYDLDLIYSVSSIVDIPVVASGGAGELIDFKKAITTANASAVAAGSLFVFKSKQKGILINYPSQRSIKDLFNE